VAAHELCIQRAAGEIVAKLIRDRLPSGQREKPSLLRRASELKLPKNPLVRPVPACLTKLIAPHLHAYFHQPVASRTSSGLQQRYWTACAAWDAIYQQASDGVPSVPTMQDELIDLLGGADNVAELTGRKSRMVRGKDGKIRFLSRASHNVPLDQVRLFPVVSTAPSGHGIPLSTVFALSCRYQ